MRKISTTTVPIYNSKIGEYTIWRPVQRPHELEIYYWRSGEPLSHWIGRADSFDEARQFAERHAQGQLEDLT